MSNEGSGDGKTGGPGEGKQGGSGAEQQDGRPRSRTRRRRPRRGEKRQEPGGARPESTGKAPETAERPAGSQPEAKDANREPGKSSKSRRRDRGRRKGAKQPNAQTDDATRPRGDHDAAREGARTHPNPEAQSARAEPHDAASPTATIPPAADSGDTRPAERRGRRNRRDDASKPSQRGGRPGRGPVKETRPPQPARWSQAPPGVIAPEEPPRRASVRPPREPSVRPPPREPGPPVFLPSTVDDVDDDAIAIDMTPWEAGIDFGDGDGTLYNSVLVRSIRGNRSREYDAGDGVYDTGELVAVEGEGGSAGFGTVVRRSRRQLIRGRLPRVLRRAQASELNVETRDKRREQEVYRIARHVANTLNLPIKIVRAQAEPNGKTVVFFASEDRIDFRELFRRVSAAAQGRVELRQLGVRDAAKMLGGVAPCGLQLCCTSFLREFAPVSIKMAKEQGLVLNPQRVSGLCGRLLCCLTYEDALYRAGRKLLPKLGKRVLTARGPGKIRDVDVLAQTIRVSLETGEIVTMTPADITPMFPSQRGADQDAAPRDERGDGRPRRAATRGREPRPRDPAPTGDGAASSPKETSAEPVRPSVSDREPEPETSTEPADPNRRET